MATERLQLVLVARARQRQRECPDPRAIDHGQERLQRHVVSVRAVVVAPAEVQADSIGRDRRHRLVDRVDVEGDRVEEAVHRLVLEEPHALHGQVGAVELQHEAARDDQLVLLAHLAGQRPDVALVRAVEGVEHDRGDDAWGRRGHERLGEALALARDAALEHLALGRRLAEVGVGDLRHRLRGVVDAGGAGAHARKTRHVVRVLGDVPRHAPLAGAAEAAHPLGRVGREPDARLLAVVADVHARLQLLSHDVAHRGLGLAGEGGGVHGLAAVLADEQVPEGGRPRKAADVSGQDPLLAAFHDASYLLTFTARESYSTLCAPGRRPRRAYKPGRPTCSSSSGSTTSIRASATSG